MMQYLEIISTTSIVIASAGIIIGVIYYFYNIHLMRKTQQTELFMQLFSIMLSNEFSEADILVSHLEYTDYNDFVEKYGPFSSRKPIHLAIRLVINYFEALGILLEEKLIDERFVLKFVAVESRWKRVAPIVKELSKEFKLEWFEYIYNLEKGQKPR